MSAMADRDNVFPHVSHGFPAGIPARRDSFIVLLTFWPALWLCPRLSAAIPHRIPPAAVSSAAGFRQDSSRSRCISPRPHIGRSFAFRVAVSMGYPAAQ